MPGLVALSKLRACRTGRCLASTEFVHGAAELATLVLSTVGSALGGPVGGAIGALIGQSFDQQLLSPARRGPRIGDLSVQTSSYGTQLPRVYGTMRVAGSVIWATDLIEGSDTTGAK